jgi:hypothetical protein
VRIVCSEQDLVDELSDDARIGIRGALTRQIAHKIAIRGRIDRANSIVVVPIDLDLLKRCRRHGRVQVCG